jgi:hypothetical protein
LVNSRYKPLNLDISAALVDDIKITGLLAVFSHIARFHHQRCRRLFKWRLDSFVDPSSKMISLDHPGTGIPAQ